MKTTRRDNLLIVKIIILILPTFVFCQSIDFFKGKSKIKNPFSLRDPFKVYIKKREVREGEEKMIVRDGIFTNLPSVENMPLEKIKIVGILVGKDRRAMARISRGERGLVLIKEGMFIGNEGAEVKAILPGGIVLVEKITNVYGQEEFLETIMPVVKSEDSEDSSGSSNNDKKRGRSSNSSSASRGSPDIPNAGATSRGAARPQNTKSTPASKK